MVMRALNKLPLDDDLVDRIFTFLPTFEALQSFILTCKAIHHVYLRYPESIVRAVAYNVAGLALPQAIRLVEYKQRSSNVHNRSRKPAELRDEPASIQPITPLDARYITQVASVAIDLEHLFSRLHKNRHSKTSTLTSLESWKFRRAIYRISLFSDHFAPKFVLLRDDDDEDQIDDLLKSCTAFVDAFPDRDVFEMRTVMLFLKELAGYVGTAGEFETLPTNFRKIAFVCGPEMILQSTVGLESGNTPDFEDIEFDPDDIAEEDLDAFLDQPITEVLKQRKLKVTDDRPQIWKEILDAIDGQDAKCELCHQVFGMDLWSDCNWDLLRGTINANDMRSLLKGRLNQSPAGVKVYTYVTSNPYSPILQAIFDDIKLLKYEALEEHHPLCIDCLKGFLSDHLHIWYREHQRKEGTVIFEDCWYGYNCRTQTHKPAHALKLNHLCEPTRGDP